MSSDHVLLVGSVPNDRAVQGALTEQSVPLAAEHAESDALDRLADGDVACIVTERLRRTVVLGL